jgi:hypothetical protein
MLPPSSRQRQVLEPKPEEFLPSTLAGSIMETPRGRIGGFLRFFQANQQT